MDLRFRGRIQTGIQPNPDGVAQPPIPLAQQTYYISRMEQIRAIGDLLRLPAVLACVGLLAACEIVDTGPTRIGGVSCGWSDAGPATPEYHRCRSRNADEGIRGDRRPGGGVGF